MPIAGRLAIMARPRAGDWLDDEISGWRSNGIDIVVSLLEANEVAELGLDREVALCRAQGMAFVSFPIPDRGIPLSLDETAALARTLARRLTEGKAVAAHCRAGIGRSSLVAACVLTSLEFDPRIALGMIDEVRGVAIPDTEEQIDWIMFFGRAIKAFP